jgi:CHAT domain-containing protein
VGRRLPGRAAIEARVRLAHGLLARSDRKSRRAPAVLAAAALCEMVLAPVAGELGRHRLVIIADGALQTIPFAALPDPSNPGEPLLAAHEIVHLLSVSVLAWSRRARAGRPPAPGMLAVLADPVFGGDDPRLPQPAAVPAVTPLLPRLPSTGREAAAILAFAPAQASLRALGFDASRETVLRGELGRYRIVHFATHGLSDPERPEQSGLVLARLDARGHPRDGVLRAPEIARLALPVELVVLSACRTALGREVRGEGIVGLAYAFLRAGAARVVVSLWNVDDAATAELMTRFYRCLLRERQTPAQALRTAQLEMLRDPRWQAPSFWAGFALQGDWQGAAVLNKPSLAVSTLPARGR